MKMPVLSYTFLRDLSNCPYKAFRKYIVKDLPKFVHTDATRWGDTVHTAFEVRIKYGTAWPSGLEKYEAIAAPLIQVGAIAEKMLGIREDGSLCDFFAKDVWMRGKIDCTVLRDGMAAIWDWKSGHNEKEEREELEVHAVLLKAWHPSITRVVAHYVWLQSNRVGKAHDVSATDQKLAEIRKTAERVRDCLAIEDFPKRRNPLCGYCPVEDCEFNTVRR